jgi:hypothetical protein
VLRAPGRHPESAGKLARAFRANDSLCYIRNFFEARQFEAIRAECATLRTRLRRERSSTAENRLGIYIPVRTHAACACACARARDVLAAALMRDADAFTRFIRRAV